MFIKNLYAIQLVFVGLAFLNLVQANGQCRPENEELTKFRITHGQHQWAYNGKRNTFVIVLHRYMYLLIKFVIKY